MITRRTKLQLIVFALITMLGVSFVGARYAKLDRLVSDQSYSVVGHFADSGGIFTGAEVSYRGVTVGRVVRLRLTGSGVDVTLRIEKDFKDIPRDTRAVVANRSAVGEQFVDLQPRTRQRPYLRQGSQIPESMTATPIAATTLLTDLDDTVESVDKQSLRTTVDELGQAFNGTGRDLGRILDTSSSFIDAANANFDVTTALLEDSNTVLGTQIDKTSAIRSFSHDLSRFSGTVASSDGDLRRVIDNGSATADELRSFLEQNEVDLGQLINNLVTTGQVTGRHLPGTEMLLVAYPYVMAGGFTVLAKDGDTGRYDAHFGLVLQQNPPVCTQGYPPASERRDPNSAAGRADKPMNFSARCSEAPSTSNARGAQNVPRRAGTAYRAPVLGSYDQSTGRYTSGDENPSGDVTYDGGAAALMGQDSWKWLLLQPLAGQG
jgi:phospholipid/cholesterol/gamma-HCH transport system substrate-binding protein